MLNVYVKPSTWRSSAWSFFKGKKSQSSKLVFIVQVQPVGVSGVYRLHLPDRGGPNELAQRSGGIRYWAHQVYNEHIMNTWHYRLRKSAI